ncbi:uncharacterized protein LOC134766573 [Penaeus indicus]|uniref:uncharacterized protein LOC134766573 n=1 Tax=Penaeus indicus TaxID=29960 RepID=UPI00300C842F
MFMEIKSHVQYAAQRLGVEVKILFKPSVLYNEARERTCLKDGGYNAFYLAFTYFGYHDPQLFICILSSLPKDSQTREHKVSQIWHSLQMVLIFILIERCANVVRTDTSQLKPLIHKLKPSCFTTVTFVTTDIHYTAGLFTGCLLSPLKYPIIVPNVLAIIIVLAQHLVTVSETLQSRSIVVVFVLVTLAVVAPSQPAYDYDLDSAYKEPAKYDFNYAVRDDYSGNDFGHQETRNNYNTQGSYYVLLPDGRLQKVTYTVNGDSGYVVEVSYEGEAQYPEYKPAPAYKPVPVYESAPAYKPGLAYETAPTYEPAPVYEPAPAYEPALTYKPAPAYEPVPVNNPAPAYEPVPVYTPSPAYEPASSYKPNPVYV